MQGAADDQASDVPPGYERATVHLRVLGQDREVRFPMRTRSATVADLLEPARAIAAEVTAAAVSDAAERGESVSCRAGCASCCRHLVPITAVEAAVIAAHVAASPPQRADSLRHRFARAVRALEGEGLLDRSAPRGRYSMQSSKGTSRERWDDVSRRYFAAAIPCPFLEDEACSIYPERPIACREHLVTSPPDRCSSLDGDVRGVARPVRVGEAFTLAIAEVTGLPRTNVPLVLALEWSEAHAAALQVERPGDELFHALVAQIEADGAPG